MRGGHFGNRLNKGKLRRKPKFRASLGSWPKEGEEGVFDKETKEEEETLKHESGGNRKAVGS